MGPAWSLRLTALRIAALALLPHHAAMMIVTHGCWANLNARRSQESLRLAASRIIGAAGRGAADVRRAASEPPRQPAGVTVTRTSSA